MAATNKEIQDLRQDYSSSALLEKDAVKDPIIQFQNWFNNALDAKLLEPNVMTLATADRSGRPSARIVLLKSVLDGGFCFYSNYLSRKGRELKKNPFGALVFFWPELERQVRIEGRIEKLDKEPSEEYFNSRPRESKISAIVSPQSQTVADRDFLEEKYNELDKSGYRLVKPAHWGGYILQPDHIEFWQGRTGRLHDRLLYTKKGTNWAIERLAP